MYVKYCCSENEALWREVATLRQKHQKQQQIVNKVKHEQVFYTQFRFVYLLLMKILRKFI